MKDWINVCLILLASFIGGWNNFIFKEKIGRVNPFLTMLVINLVLVSFSAIGLIGWWLLGTEIKLPSKTAFRFIFASGLISSIAVLCHLFSYYRDASIVMVTTVMCLLPVFACTIRFYMEHELPHVRELAGYLLIFVAVYLFTHRSTG